MNIKRISIPIMFLAGFLLFWEWLRPLGEVTDTGSMYVFVVYTAICFLASYFIKNGFARFFVKIAALILALDYLFFDPLLLSSSWVQQLYLELSLNFEVIEQNNWVMMTSFFRSLLFMIVLWLMSYLLHYWFTVANKFFLFVVLTFIYLAILDTFTAYDAQFAMVRTFIISFVMLGLSRYLKLIERTGRSGTRRNLFQWLALVAGIITFATLAGIYLPKLDPQWPDPVPFIQSNADHIGFGTGGTVQKVGYGEDDSQLGGSFVQDDSSVFEAIAHDDVYWRIESKDVYTGSGWERSADLNYEMLEDGVMDFETFSMFRVETDPYTATIRPDVQNALPRIVYPYGGDQLSTNNPTNFYMDKQFGIIEAETGEQNQSTSYSVDYEAPSYSINALREDPGNDEAEIRDQYLQLPDELPERVGELAEEITVEADNRYDRAKAVEGYFGANGFRYQTTDVSIPEEGEDYVDQFLFETQVGYCDNFSTSMVVLLRSLDIPARWVKGFTGGTMATEQPPLPDEYSLYEITNNNAHSWVEVYFPETGWVAFEPTSGFANPTDFYYEAADADNDSDEAQETETDPTENQEEPEEETEEEEETDDNAASGVSDNQDHWNGWPYVWTGLGVVLLILGLIAYLKRRDIQHWYVQRKWHRLLKNQEVESAYMYLLKVLAFRGYKLGKGQTLRQYAKKMDEHFDTTEMSEITDVYEGYVYYKQNANQAELKRLQQLFKQLGSRIFT